jgi:hypothetical protein
MASVFKRYDNPAVGATRSLVYTVPTGVTAIVFAGEFTNLDTVNKSNHNATLEVLLADNVTYVPYAKKDVPVAYGGPLAIEKRVLSVGEKVYATSDVAGMLSISLSVVEK